MFDAKDKSVDPRFGVNVSRFAGSRPNAAKSFQFPVTWTSLTAHLQLREAAEMTSAAVGEPERARQLDVAALPSRGVAPLMPGQEISSDSDARWEMVVPKMDRADRVPRELGTAASLAQRCKDDIYIPLSLPQVGGSRDPLPRSLSGALAAIGRRTRLLLAGSSKSTGTAPMSFPGGSGLVLAYGRSSHLQVLQLKAPSFPVPVENQIAKIEDMEERRELRELLLSKITSTLRSRSATGDDRQVQWPKASV